jgi:uncharacterized protein YydD (DUF2326 family)
MKLSKLYSNKSQFKPIIFNEGLNVIYAFSDTNIRNQVAEHNLGKTSLVYLINFLLLQEKRKGTFFKTHDNVFKDWVFYLEVQLNTGDFVTIKRGVKNDTKISFKRHDIKDQDFVGEDRWDYVDLPLSSRDPRRDPKVILSEQYFKLDIKNNEKFRKFLFYLLRTQNDYRDVFRIDEHPGKDRDWKPQLYDILGYDGSLLEKKYHLEEKLSIIKSLIKQSSNEVLSSEQYELKAAIAAKKKESETLKKQLNEFKFYSKEKKINLDLVQNIEKEVSFLNKNLYRKNKRLENLRSALIKDEGPDIDFNKLKQLFKEVQIYFPQNLNKDYNDLEKFSKQITSERSNFLNQEIKLFEQEVKEINQKLEHLDKVRAKTLSILGEEDSFRKYKEYQHDLMSIEKEILLYEQRLSQVHTVERYEEDKEQITAEIKDVIKVIKNDLNHEREIFVTIREIFQDVYKSVFNTPPLLVVKLNSNGNIDFDAVALNESQNLSGRGEGYTSKKVLCASLVIAILCAYSDKSFYRFTYQDGIMESWGDEQKSLFIDILRKYTEKYNIQYIFSIIQSDVPNDLDISPDEIIRKLSAQDTLFGLNF